MAKTTFTDSKKVERIGKCHPDIGKYRIEVSKVLEHDFIIGMCENLNNMPSSLDNQLFQVFHVKERVSVGKKNGKEITVPGFIIRRKVIINDRVEYLEPLLLGKGKKGLGK